MATLPPARPSPWTIVAGLTAAGLLLFLVGAAVVVATGSHYAPLKVDLSAADAEAAYAACQAAARKELKAPGPLTFEPLREWRVRRYMDGRIRVRADADAVNGAGRHIDIRVQCRMRPLDSGGWDIHGLSISTD